MKLITFSLSLLLGLTSAASPWGSVDGVQPSPLDITQYTLTFSDDFNSLSVSCTSPKSPSTWYCHKPDGQDFGQVGFNNFSVAGGVLTIPLVLVSGTWEGGILSSIDNTGVGFTQQYGYFEWKMQLSPVAGGNWPAAWLLAACHIPFPGTCDDVEVDVLEQFGNFKPSQLNSVYHHWISPTPVAVEYAAMAGEMITGYHLYGVDIEADFTTIYFDRYPIQRFATPTELKTPMYVLVDQACSNAPTCPGTTSPANLLVDYIRVYTHN